MVIDGLGLHVMLPNGPKVELVGVTRRSILALYFFFSHYPFTVQGGYGAAFACNESGYWRRDTFEETLLMFENFLHYRSFLVWFCKCRGNLSRSAGSFLPLPSVYSAFVILPIEEQTSFWVQTICMQGEILDLITLLWNRGSSPNIVEKHFLQQIYYRS
jgi:hypothetical protein